MKPLPLALGEASTVTLHRLHIRPCGDRNWFVTRWGGKSMIAVNRQGLDAIRSLNGRTMGAIRASLPVDAASTAAQTLHSVLQVLYGANLIKRIDGQRMSAREITLSTLANFVYRVFIRPRLEKAAQIVLPVRYIPAGIALVNYCAVRSRVVAQRQKAAAHIAAVFHQWPEHVIKAAQREHVRYLTSVKLDPEMLAHRSPWTVDRWLGKHVDIEGIEHLDGILSTSRSTIIALCHMNRFTLAPLVLLKRGYRLCVINNLQATDSAQRRMEWYRRFAAAGYADIEIIPNFNFANVSRVIELTKRGYVLLGCPDAAPPTDVVRQRSQFFGYRYSALEQTTIRVPLQQHMISGWVWFFWLAAYTDMPLLPAVMRPRGDESVLTFSPTITVPTGEPIRTRTELLARAYYSYWAQQVSAHPGHWFGWHKFDSWMPSRIDAPVTQPCDSSNDITLDRRREFA